MGDQAEGRSDSQSPGFRLCGLTLFRRQARRAGGGPSGPAGAAGQGLPRMMPSFASLPPHTADQPGPPADPGGRPAPVEPAPAENAVSSGRTPLPPAQQLQTRSTGAGGPTPPARREGPQGRPPSSSRSNGSTRRKWKASGRAQGRGSALGEGRGLQGCLGEGGRGMGVYGGS